MNEETKLAEAGETKESKPKAPPQTQAQPRTPKAYDPFDKIGRSQGELLGTKEGFVYTQISAKDYRGAALDEIRLRLESEGYSLTKGVTSPHNPQAEVWCRPQQVEDVEFQAKKFDLAKRRAYAEMLLRHPEYEPRKSFRDLILGFHGLISNGRQVSEADLKKGAREYPVHPGRDD